jgi:tRNA(Ile)-lysidine synthase
MGFSADRLAQVLARLLPAEATGLVVGVSGGLDSSCLAAALAQLPRRLPLRAVHVDHGLQPAASDFRDHVRQLCERNAIPLQLVAVTVAAPSGTSVEAAARDARYGALAAQLASGECLLTAHTCDDQAETFLLQALRGAGPQGLAAMPAVRRLGAGWQLRPLLGVLRADLQVFAATRGISAAIDPMNGDARFDRVYLRQSVWPALQHRWAGAAAALARAAQHSAEAQQELDALADVDLVQLRDGDALSVTGLRRLPAPRQLLALRRWLDQGGATLPSTARLLEALRQMLESRSDQLPAVSWSSHALRRYRGRIFLTAAAPPGLQLVRQWDWRRDPVLELGSGLGRLRALERSGGLALPASLAFLEVRPRAGGERLRVAAAARTQTVQHLCQARGILPWMRDALPFVFAGDTLVGVGDLWSSAAHCTPDGQPGLALAWEHPLRLA